MHGHEAIKRDIIYKIHEVMKKFPVLELTRPRQSGKTTLAQNLFEDHQYTSLEDLEVRTFAKEDPKGFLSQYETTPVIIDEAQHVPELFSYIQVIVDKHQQPRQFTLTASQNFLSHEKIIQSLAGRVALLQLA